MNTLKQKVAGRTATIAISATMALALVMPFAASAVTIEELQAQINLLLAQLATLQGGPSTGAAACTFTRSLTLKSRGDDVTCLQTYLQSTGHYTYSGGATGYFGPVTKAAVAAWQAANGVSPAVGYFGSLSRVKYTAVGGSVVVVPPVTPPVVPGVPVAAGTVSVSSAEQPAATISPLGASRQPYTKFNLTAGAADVIISSVTVERQGFGDDDAIASLVLLDEDGLQIGISKTLNSDHRAILNEPFTVKAGTTRMVTVAVNRPASESTSNDGQILRFSVVAVNAGASSVSGSFPVVGNGMTMNSSVSLGSVTAAVGPKDPGANQTKEVGSTAYTFASIKWTAGSAEDVWFKSISWNQSGSATNADLTNIKVYVNDVAYDTVVSSDGKYYTAKMSGSGILVKKGESIETYIKGDVAGGSGRGIDFDLYRTTDVYFVGALNGYGVAPAAGSSTSSTPDDSSFNSDNPYFDGRQVTVSAGSLNVEKDNTVAAQNVAENLSNQPLGGFTVEVKGEPVQTSSLTVNLTIIRASGTSQGIVDLTNVAIYNEAGSVIAGPKDGTGTAANGTIVFTDTITWPVGKFKYAIKGKLGTDFVNNDTVQASTTPSSDWTSTGANTGTSITETPASAVTLSLMTVKAGSLTISTSPSPVAQNVIAGAQGFLFANYQFDATASGEDVRMASVPLAYGRPDAASATALTTCQLWDGTTVLNSGSNVVNPSAQGSSTTFTFDGSGFTVPKGTVKTVALKCNVAANSTGSFLWGSDTGATYTATGLTSGTTITPTAIDSNGQLMTSATAGTLTVSLDSSSPAYYIASAGTNDNTLAVLKFHAANEAINLKKVAFNLTTVASNSPQELVGEKITLWDGATKVGEAIFTAQTADFATSTLTADFIIPKDGDKIMTVKGSFAAIGIGQPGVSGDLMIVDWDGAGSETEGTGVDSGSTIDDSSASDTASNGVRIFKSYPTVAKIDFSDKLTSGRRDLLKFKITAAPQGDVGIASMVFNLATSSVTTSIDMVDGLNVYVYTDSGFSSVATGVQTDGAFIATNKDLSVGVWTSSASELEFWAETAANASTTLNIPAGQTRYFVVRGDVTTAGATFSAVMTMLGDSAYPTTGMSPVNEVKKIANSNDFIWTPFGTTTTVTVGTVGSLDASSPVFTGGFNVPGLSSSGFSQTLSQ